METYLNKNYKNAIESLKVCKGQAKDSGRDYYYIELTFINGFKKRMFPNDGERFAYINSFDLCDSDSLFMEKNNA